MGLPRGCFCKRSAADGYTTFRVIGVISPHYTNNPELIFGGQIAGAPNLGTNDVFVLRHANGI